jgi:hypothetical protein
MPIPISADTLKVIFASLSAIAAVTRLVMEYRRHRSLEPAPKIVKSESRRKRRASQDTPTDTSRPLTPSPSHPHKATGSQTIVIVVEQRTIKDLVLSLIARPDCPDIKGKAIIQPSLDTLVAGSEPNDNSEK